MSAVHPLRERRAEMLARLQSNVPHELRELTAWLVFRLEPKAGRPGEWDKIPYYANGQKRFGQQGSTDDLACLADFATVMRVLTVPGSRYDGLGFAVLPCHPVVALDLDKLNEKPHANALMPQILATGSYCEVSPSGTGRRAFFFGKPGIGNRKNHDAGVEVFETVGFVTVTGNELSEGADLQPMPDALRARIELMLGERKERFRPRPLPSAEAADLEGLNDLMRHRARAGFPKGTRDRSAWLFRFAFDLRTCGLSESQTLAILADPDLAWCAPALERRGGEMGSAREWLWRYCVEPAYAQPVVKEWRNEPLDFLRQAVAPEFTADDVPPQLAQFACAMASAAGFDPSGLIASSVSAAAAALSDGLRLEVSPASDYYESARLWVLLVGGPGLAKTPSINAATKPLREMHREASAVHKDRQEVEDARAARAGEKPEKIPRVALYTSDATTEALAAVLEVNERGLLYLTDEFEAWIGGHDAYRSGGGGSRDRGEWLRAFDGGPHQVDRVTRGPSYVPNWGVSILTATTPTVLQKLSRKLPADGLLQRFIPVLLRQAGKANRDTDAVPYAKSYHDTLVRLYACGPATGVRVVKLTEAAAELLADERDRLRELAVAVEVYGDGFAGHVAKYGALLARLTLTFHAVACPEGIHPADCRVDTASVRLAARFLRKVFRHAQVLYADLMGNEGAAALARAVAAVILADKRLEVSRRELIHGCHAWRKAGDERLRDYAMQFLVDAGWLREVAGEYAKAHPTHWEVNPAVHEKFAEHGARHLERRRFVANAIREQADAR